MSKTLKKKRKIKIKGVIIFLFVLFFLSLTLEKLPNNPEIIRSKDIMTIIPTTDKNIICFLSSFFTFFLAIVSLTFFSLRILLILQ